MPYRLAEVTVIFPLVEVNLIPLTVSAVGLTPLPKDIIYSAENSFV